MAKQTTQELTIDLLRRANLPRVWPTATDTDQEKYLRLLNNTMTGQCTALHQALVELVEPIGRVLTRGLERILHG